MPALRQAWERLLAHLGLDPAATWAVYDELIRRYGEAGRHYHDRTHLSQVLALCQRLAQRCAEPAAVELAAWFHDAVYDPRAADNEEQSAALAAALLGQLKLPADLIERVQALVLATKTHQAQDVDAAVLLDADLAILGAEPAEYARYAGAIRQEYAWVADDAYRQGRRQVLKGFLQRPRIYRTDEMFQTHEAAARRNVTQEVAQLSAFPPARE
jgi:predicted metal-dependent HD superfamily phosphohydrolase